MMLILQYMQGFLFWFISTFLLLYFVHKRRESVKNKVYSLLFVAYMVALCSVTLFPSLELGIDGTTGKLYIDMYFPKTEIRGINLIPFKTVLSELMGENPLVGSEDRLAVSVLNLLGNIILYIPIGFFLSKMRKKKNICFVLLISIAISCSIEILQYTAGRSADIDDVILHTIGTTSGHMLSNYCNCYIKHTFRQ